MRQNWWSILWYTTMFIIPTSLVEFPPLIKNSTQELTYVGEGRAFFVYRIKVEKKQNIRRYWIKIRVPKKYRSCSMNDLQEYFYYKKSYITKPVLLYYSKFLSILERKRSPCWIQIIYFFLWIEANTFIVECLCKGSKYRPHSEY